MITIDDVRASKVIQTTHYNGGKEWFGYGHKGVEYPRLYRLDRYMRKDRSVVSEWQVDGEKCESIEQAVERLNVPPALTADERAMLALITPEYIGRSELKAKPEYEAIPDQLNALHFLNRKGLIEWSQGRVRLTAASTTGAA